MLAFGNDELPLLQLDMADLAKYPSHPFPATGFLCCKVGSPGLPCPK
jgi:hypothetical protein